jgi:hypothetical protein
MRVPQLQAARTERTQVLRIPRLLLSLEAPAGGAIRKCQSDTITGSREAPAQRRTGGSEELRITSATRWILTASTEPAG